MALRHCPVTFLFFMCGILKHLFFKSLDLPVDGHYFRKVADLYRSLQKDHREVVKRLIRARQEAGLRQEDVARKLGVTQSHVSDIEAGSRRIDLILLSTLSRIYKTPFLALVSSKAKLLSLRDTEAVLRKRNPKSSHAFMAGLRSLFKGLK
jgi:transcriptional regulator with XRE-family HTH domain